MPRAKKPSVEEIKLDSNYLSGDLAEQLSSDTTHVDEAGYQLLKFSGMYQQDDRDRRKALRKEGKNKDYSFMVRTKLPGGIMSAEQYLVHDELASRFGNETLRFTTRQGIQLHGIVKGDIKPMLQAFDDALVTTLAACGDVVRNVMACPAPKKDREHALLKEAADALEAQFLPRSSGYYDLWLNGKRVEQAPQPAPHTPPVDEVEPIYGKTYLPRKFKIGIAFPHDNCVDVFTQDIGIVPVLDGDTLQGYNILVGGGLGMKHTDETTFPKLAQPLGFVEPDDLVKASEVIISIQRDFGNRKKRTRARMKYLIHEWGMEKFRTEFEARFGKPVGEWLEVGPFTLDDHLGWHAQGDGRYFYGIPVENGRIKDEGEMRLRTALRKIAERFGTELRITAQHNLLATNLEENQQEELLTLLQDHGVRTKDDISKARRYSIACPALPTCGLALTESERIMPEVVDGLEQTLAALGLESEDISVRMTGCPNGCARPYTAELAFVGRSLDRYKIFVGGSFEGLHLATEYADMVPTDELIETVQPLLESWQQKRNNGERFGDFCRRVGVERLQETLLAPA